jgi:hypothetical protein
MVQGADMKLCSRSALLGLILALAQLLPRAADEKKEALPQPREILERFAKEIGGKDAFRKHSSQHATGTVEMPAQNLNGKLEVFAARPNKLLMKVALPGLGDVTTGYTGEIGWMSTAITGPMLIEGKMIEEVATQADFDHAIHDPADYKVMELLGKEDFNGEQCYKLKLVHRSGFESIAFFSIKSGLQRGFIATSQTQFGPVTATTTVVDYKKFGDLLLPARTSQKASGIETVMTIEQMEYDKVDPAVFELPAEVKTLLQQKKKTAQQPAEKQK